MRAGFLRRALQQDRVSACRRPSESGRAFCWRLVEAGTLLVLSAVPQTHAQYEVLHEFRSHGAYPYAGLASDGLGHLYGTTYSGGSQNLGTIYRVGIDGSDPTVLFSFGGYFTGSRPLAAPTFDGVSTLYGTTFAGGDHDLGLVYRINIDGTGFQVLHEFSGPVDGANPVAPLTLDGAGILYGTTQAGGDTGHGVVFRMATDGTGFAYLWFWGPTDGAQPDTKLLLNGTTLYGTTFSGGTYDRGVLFRVDTILTALVKIHEFGNPAIPGDSSYPLSNLILVNGLFVELYGTTYSGGAFGGGTVFRVRTNGAAFTTLHSFDGSTSDGYVPIGGLVRDGSGNLYGTTEFGGASNLGTVFKMNATGSSFELLHSFTGGPTDGYHPENQLVLENGNLYGTAVEGGVNARGVVFRLSTSGESYGLLHDFDVDGNRPEPLVRGEPGVLYGATTWGGTSGFGTVYRIHEDGSGYEILRSFNGGVSDGKYPLGGLTFVPPNHLFGVTDSGGFFGEGTLYSLSTDGSAFSIVYSFSNAPGFAYDPRGAPVFDGVDTLYGTTRLGGLHGEGTIYEVKIGFSPTFLFSFGEPGMGRRPGPSLLWDGSGSLYGTAEEAGPSEGGILFKFTPTGLDYEVLRDFNSYLGDGLAVDASGRLYGASLHGGNFDAGALFGVEPDGTNFDIVHAFEGGELDGQTPESGPALDGLGRAFGTTDAGGANGGGALYRAHLDGSGFALLHSFPTPDYYSSALRPVYDGGVLYGTVSYDSLSHHLPEVLYRFVLGDIFADGFESGDSTAWTLTVP